MAAGAAAGALEAGALAAVSDFLLLRVFLAVVAGVVSLADVPVGAAGAAAVVSAAAVDFLLFLVFLAGVAELSAVAAV